MSKAESERHGLYRVEKGGEVVFSSGSALEARRERDRRNGPSIRGRGYQVVSGYQSPLPTDLEAVARREQSARINGALGGAA